MNRDMEGFLNDFSLLKTFVNFDEDEEPITIGYDLGEDEYQEEEEDEDEGQDTEENDIEMLLIHHYAYAVNRMYE